MNSQQETFSFGTDFHGNLQNIDQFLRESHEREVEHVVFGGDMTPKKMAIKMADGMAAVYSGKPQTNSPIMPAKTAYEKGYMLFGMPMTSLELQLLDQTVRKLMDIDHAEFSLEEVKFLETKKHLFLEYFKNTESGQKAFTAFQEKFNGLYPGKWLQGVPDFLNRMMWYAKILCARQQNMNFVGTKSVLALLLCGDTRKTREAQKRWDLAFSFPMLNPRVVFERFLHEGFWKKWIDTHNTLWRHAEDGQRRFTADFIERIRDLRQTFNGSVSLILGNDDLEAVGNDFDEAERGGLLVHATNRVVQLSPDVQMLGYSRVPFIPLPGIYSAWFRDEDGIAEDLTELAADLRDDISYTIGNIHCPPFGGNLDQAEVRDDPTRHWGSEGVRKFLEETGRQIDVVLCGHIHDSLILSGEVQDKIGRSAVYNPGASEYQPRFVFGSVAEPQAYERSGLAK